MSIDDKHILEINNLRSVLDQGSGGLKVTELKAGQSAVSQSGTGTGAIYRWSFRDQSGGSTGEFHECALLTETIDGSGNDGEIAVWDSAGDVAGHAEYTYDSTLRQMRLTGPSSGDAKYTVDGCGHLEIDSYRNVSVFSQTGHVYLGSDSYASSNVYSKSPFYVDDPFYIRNASGLYPTSFTALSSRLEIIPDSSRVRFVNKTNPDGYIQLLVWDTPSQSITGNGDFLINTGSGFLNIETAAGYIQLHPDSGYPVYVSADELNVRNQGGSYPSLFTPTSSYLELKPYNDRFMIQHGSSSSEYLNIFFSGGGPVVQGNTLLNLQATGPVYLQALSSNELHLVGSSWINLDGPTRMKNEFGAHSDSQYTFSTTSGPLNISVGGTRDVIWEPGVFSGTLVITLTGAWEGQEVIVVNNGDTGAPPTLTVNYGASSSVNLTSEEMLYMKYVNGSKWAVQKNA